MTAPAYVLAAVRSIPHPSIPHPRQEPDMTALYPLEPHTEAEEATLARIEGAEPDENGAVEKVARALYDRIAAAAIEAMRGQSAAVEALARVEALCAGAGPARHFGERRTVTVDAVRAAIAGLVAQAGEGR